ncbi:hypothetical protein Taro_039057 [Colocasia esculenta]|uniref:RRM domain-containing protein n=1 Tax=Colocasia esculenta TaxID=4460 RepID=A0A843WEL8_COLES|nr:hypothetical protein [Colocasia esculenta]
MPTWRGHLISPSFLVLPSIGPSLVATRHRRSAASPPPRTTSKAFSGFDMAAAAAVRACFSAVITPSIQRRHQPSGGVVSFGLRALRAPNNVARTTVDIMIVGGAAPQSWRLPWVAAAVIQEEATAAVVEEAEVEGGEDRDMEAEATVNTKLYFGNLPYNCDSAQLAGIIQEYATPEMVEVSNISNSGALWIVLYDKETGRSRGFGFVTMSSIVDCEAVIQNLDGSQYSGRILRVNFSDKPKAKEPLYPESEHKLFVGNLSWSVTSESLIQTFQDYGHVVGARVIFDGDTGRSRGYGFVCYSSKSEMDVALDALNGRGFEYTYSDKSIHELEGRAMRISLALGKRS